MWMYPFSRSKDEINYNLQQDQKEKKEKKRCMLSGKQKFINTSVTYFKNSYYINTINQLTLSQRYLIS